MTNAKDYQPNLRVFTIVVLTSGNKYESAISTITLDPVDFVTHEPLGEIEHKVFYLTPKPLNSDIPEPYHEWLRAMADSLDEQVEESEYGNPVVLKVFDLIQRDGLTPRDRARLKDEYSLEKANQEIEAKAERRTRFSLAQKLLQQGKLDLVSIADVTGLSIEELKSFQGVTQLR